MSVNRSFLARMFQGWAVRRHPPDPLMVALDQRRVYILPTAGGWLFASLLLVMFLASTNYGVSLGFLFTFVLAGFGLVCMWHTHQNLLGLTLHKPVGEPVFEGQDACFLLRMKAPGPHPRYMLVAVTARSGECVVDLEAGAAGRFQLRLPASRRGVLRLGRMQVYTQYPTGLFRAWTWVDFGSECLVYPRPAGDRQLPAGAVEGNHGQTDSVPEPDDFKALREYSPGDSPRHVAWKAAAKSGTLLTKQFDGKAGSRLTLDWSTLTRGDAESRLSQLCLWVLSAEERGMEYGLRLPGTEIAPSKGTRQRQRCLEALARFPARLP